jgi:hypothetical protein
MVILTRSVAPAAHVSLFLLLRAGPGRADRAAPLSIGLPDLCNPLVLSPAGARRPAAAAVREAAGR